MSDPQINVGWGQYLQLAVLRSNTLAGDISVEECSQRMQEILGNDLFRVLEANDEAGLVTQFGIKSKEEHSDEELSELGFQGLKRIGFSPQQARDKIAGRMTEETLAFFRQMPASQLQEKAANWIAKGLAPPWEGKL